MKTGFPRRLCSLAAAIVLIGVALFTGGCATGYDDYYGGGVYDYGYGGPFYGGYYGSYYGGGYYGGGGGYYPGRPGYNPGGPRPSHPISGVGPGNSYVRPTPHGGGGGYRGGGGGRGGGGRR